MASDSLKKIQIKEFVKHREGKGDEKQETQKFWNSLLQKVFGVKSNEIKKIIDYEKTVKIDTTKYIDGYINDTKVLIEQKSHDIDLNKAEKQSDGIELTPYQQAKRYADNLPHSENPRRIITCNFQEFHIHDMEKEKPQDNPEIVYLKDLPKEYHRLKFIIDSGDRNIKKEMDLSIKAGEIVGKLYDSLAPLYKDISDLNSQKSLNILCVRLVFCLYAEDAGVFGIKNLFHDYLNNYKTEDLRDALIKLFVVLDQKIEERDPYLKEDLSKFPYVNGGLFADEGIEIPNLNEEVRNLLLEQASENFDRSEISPTIFGAVFESTLNPETRRSGGMHYTSIENIHKVIDPLFLDDLNENLDGILKLTQPETIRKKGRALQEKMASLKFLDPACGSGNFLTETYLSLRRIENKIIEKEGKGVARLINPIEVNINQFYGIEINDFAVSVAKTALWIAESQMMNETEEILGESLDFLPLKTNANIVEGNALRVDRNEVISNKECNYIMGNPPFIGARMMAQGSEQKKDIENLFGKIKDVQDLDYVTGWYIKSAEYIQNSDIEVGFVSTDSITCGIQVGILRPFLKEKYGIVINFAYRAFKRNSESNDKAQIYCIIIGFSTKNRENKILYLEDNIQRKCNNINPYLIDFNDVYVFSRTTPLCNVPEVVNGNMERGGVNLILTDEEKNEILEKEPQIEKYIKPFYGADEFLSGKKRWCIRLVGANFSDILKSKILTERINKVKEHRLNSPAKTTRDYAKDPTVFAQRPQPEGVDRLIIPRVSAKGEYIPLGFMTGNDIASDKVHCMPNATLYHFGVLESSVHMAWTRAISMRLGDGYSYSRDIVFNNFPRPNPSEQQIEKIKQTANNIIIARNKYSDLSIRKLYGNIMPIELQKAHKENDKAVMQAYGFSTKMTESECVAKLMEMYQKLVNTK